MGITSYSVLVLFMSFGKGFKFSPNIPISMGKKGEVLKINYSYTTQSKTLVLMVIV